MKHRSAFTLFELILAIALSATLLALIGTAINLYLLRVDTGRERVEEAQLARSILATIAADVRAATIYQTQDISGVTQLAVSNAEFDVDGIDQAGEFEGALGTPGAAGTAGAAGDASGMTSLGGPSMSGQQTTTGLSPGLNGTLEELILDVARLPRLDEMSQTLPQQPTATLPVALNQPRPSDVKTIRYAIREGVAIDPSDVATTSLAADQQLRAGGLVRQTIDRAVRQMAEQSGNSTLLESGQVLVAPEVVQIQFRYFDGTTAVEEWNMQERSAMPTAIDVRIWLAADESTADDTNAISSRTRLADAHMYSQTVELPLAPSAGTGGSASSMGTESTGSESVGSSGEDTGQFGNQPR